MDGDDTSRDIGAQPLTFRTMEPAIERLMRFSMAFLKRAYGPYALGQTEASVLAWEIHQAANALNEAYKALDKQDREGDPT